MLSRLRHLSLRPLPVIPRHTSSAFPQLRLRRLFSTPPFRVSHPHAPSLLSPFLLASTFTATVYCLCPSPAQTEPPPPPSPLTWPAVVRELRRQQHQYSLPPFSAHRHSAPNGWAFTLHCPCVPSADPFSLLASLVRDLLDGEASVVVDDTATRTVFTLSHNDTFEVAISVPRISPFDTTLSVELIRAEGPEATFSAEEVDALVRAYYLAQGAHDVSAQVPMETGPLLDGKDSVDIGPPTVLERRRGGATYDDYSLPVGGGKGIGAKRARAKLEELGVEVFSGEGSDLGWDALAGYDDVKERIENTLTLPLKHPDVYENIVRGTRKRFESNLPKAVLYEGPPGCGKTLSAKILAASIGVPFVHVPLETILSKFYGETTRKLAEILQTANELGRCLVFIDEADSIGMSRSSPTEVHEVTRRTLSVLLRHIDGLDGPQNTILLAATNHKEDIDPALMSRFDVVVSFPLPDLETRKAVLALYAKHLSQEELCTMAELSDGFSGRELLDVCEEAERTYAGYIVRQTEAGKNRMGGEDQGQLPSLKEYAEAIMRKAPHAVGRDQGSVGRARDVDMQSMTVGPRPAVAT